MVTNIKVKNLSEKELIISIDRLTRFKYPEDKYLRVFKELILSNLIEPKFKKKDLDVFDYSSLRDFAQLIINNSIKEFTGNTDNSGDINKSLIEYETSVFSINDEAMQLLNNNINYDGFLKLINENSVSNLKWLKSLNNNKLYLNNTKFPIKKVVLVEGITEEILLPVFGEICNYNFDKNGIQIVSAGGKNQVVKLFYKFAEQLKIPIFVLLDNDAKDNFKQISEKIRKKDKIHLISGGEIEDILPKDLIIKTLNDHFINLNIIEEDDFTNERMVINLEEIFKKKGFHEFKKAEFAQLIKEHINCSTDLSEEIRTVIKEIKSVHSF